MSLSVEEKRRLTLALSRVKGFGNVRFVQLLEHYGGSDKVFSLFEEHKLDSKLQLEWKQSAQTDWEAALVREGLAYVCLWEQSYPKLLKQVPDPPTVLFYKGNISRLAADAPNLAVVGTRKATKFGKELAQEFCTDMVRAGFGIISGMAFGVDSTAHLAALAAGGYTVAVLASAASEPSPATNEWLYRKILRNGGAIMSEIFPGTLVTGGMFASRNRIVAGLASGTLVVEAGAKSGALITASVAFDYDREVFAIPGIPFGAACAGCNRLIKEDKAHLVESAKDILIELNYPVPPCDKDQARLDFSPSEQKVINILSQEALSLDELSLAVDISNRDALSLLSVLEVKGAVRSENGYYMILSQHAN